MYPEISETWFLDQVFLNRPNNHLDNLSQGQFGKNRLEKIGKHWYERRLFSHLILFESADLYHNIKNRHTMTFSKKNLAFVQVQGHLIHFEIVQYLKHGHKWKRLKGYMTYGFRANYNCDKNVTMEMNPSLIACHLQHQCLSHSEITK